MTYQPNPDTPIASEQHPELYERMCKARAFIEQVLVAYVKARKANGMSEPLIIELWNLEYHLDENEIDDEFSISDAQCKYTLGEGYLLDDEQLQALIKGAWE